MWKETKEFLSPSRNNTFKALNEYKNDCICISAAYLASKSRRLISVAEGSFGTRRLLWRLRHTGHLYNSKQKTIHIETRTHTCAEWHIMGHGRTRVQNGTSWDTDAHMRRMAHHGTRTHTCAEWHIMGHGHTRVQNSTSRDTDAHMRRMAHQETRTHTCAERHIKRHGRTRVQNGTLRDTDAHVCRTAHQVSEQITKRSPTTTSCGPSGARLLGFLPSTCGVRFSSVSESVSHNEYCIITNENNKLQLRRKDLFYV